jgi:hypothetical protein
MGGVVFQLNVAILIPGLRRFIGYHVESAQIPWQLELAAATPGGMFRTAFVVPMRLNRYAH